MRPIFKLSGIAKAIGASAIAAATLHADAHAYEFYRSVSGWEVVSIDDGCGMIMEYEGPGATTIALLKGADGSLVLKATNSNWTAKNDEKYEIAFVLDGVEFSGAGALGVGDYRRRGFIASFSSDFEKHFAAGSTLHIYLGDQQIDQLSLRGTAAALASVNACLSGVRRELAAKERERRRWEHLPKDPFAKPPAPPEPPGTKLRPPKNAGDSDARWTEMFEQWQKMED